jgi:hypothetical protein
MKQTKIEDFITLALEDNTFEDILEKFDLTPQEVFTILYEGGFIDEEVLLSECDVVYE